jgi:hypothetical protein
MVKSCGGLFAKQIGEAHEMGRSGTAEDKKKEEFYTQVLLPPSPLPLLSSCSSSPPPFSIISLSSLPPSPHFHIPLLTLSALHLFNSLHYRLQLPTYHPTEE